MCVCVCVRACVRACMRACVCTLVSMTFYLLKINYFHLLLSLEDAKCYVEIFTQMNRQSQLQSYYNSCRKVRSNYAYIDCSVVYCNLHSMYCVLCTIQYHNTIPHHTIPHCITPYHNHTAPYHTILAHVRIPYNGAHMY